MSINMRPIISTPAFYKLLLAQVALIALVQLLPQIGTIHPASVEILKMVRAEALPWLRLLLVLFCVFQLLSFDLSPAKDETRWVAFRHSLHLATLQAMEVLFNKKPVPIAHRERWQSAGIALCFAVLFLILLAKNLGNFESQPDLHFHQSFLDYTLDWRTPVFALGGNLLYNFGIQVPLNTHLSPMIGLAHALSPRFQIAIALTFFFATVCFLFWSVGGILRLRPIPRVIFAGLVGLIVIVPSGLDRIMLVVPPYFLTHLVLCGLWWGEASILSLVAVYLFFLLGRTMSVTRNVALAVGFCVLCSALLLAFAEGAFFIVPIICFYSIAFFVTGEQAREFWWKTVVAGMLAAGMLLVHIPTYFRDLYSYSYGAYFAPRLWNDVDAMTLLKSTTMAIALNYDFRVPMFVAVSLGTLGIYIARGSGAPRRIAVAVLFCEACIVLLGCINALTFKYPIGLFYSEVLHEPFLAAFFVLALLFAATIVVLQLDALFRCIRERGNAAYFKGWIAQKRVVLNSIVWVVAVLTLLRSPFLPTAQSLQTYPASSPPSVQILEGELSMKPGKPFPGRALVLAGMLAAPGLQWPGGPGSIIDVIDRQYKLNLGNDHYVNLLPFGISVADEFGHWTSPPTFVALRNFFGRKDDIVDNKAFFPLRAFNPRIARLFEIRMVVTDGPPLDGGTLVYETKAGTAALRLFRLNRVNLGQFSPTQAILTATASQAIDTMERDTFDPERDVVVEEQIDGNLVPAQSVSVVTDFGPTLTVRAESPGRSLLVLPFEFSRCLRIDSEEQEPARLVAVNLQQTGLLFDQHVSARISYRFGVFDHPQCRREDLARADRLRLYDTQF